MRDRSEHRRSSLTRANNRVDQMSGRGLTVGAGDTHQLELRRGMPMHQRSCASERNPGVLDLNPGIDAFTADRLFRDNRDRSAFNCLRNKTMRIGFLTANRNENKSWFADTRIVRHIDCLCLEAACSIHSAHFFCQTCQRQFVRPALLCGGSPDDGVFIVGSTSNFRAASLESLTRHVVCGDTSAPGDGFCSETTPSPEALSFIPSDAQSDKASRIPLPIRSGITTVDPNRLDANLSFGASAET